jgi:hypothetical protein
MGGTDDPSNLIELSVEEHAEAHKKLFEEHGHWQDYLAWQGLSKIIPREELISMVQSEAAKERLRNKGNPFSGIQTPGNFAINEEFRKQVAKLANSPEAIVKKKKTMAERKHQQGSKNSQYGSIWVTHKEYGNKKIKAEMLNEFLSLGYSKGRVMAVN